MVSRGWVSVTVALFLGAASARAADKATCAAAAEVGQRMVKAHKLVSAREQLLLCSSRDCPEVISQDCTQWLGEVERSMSSVVLKARDMSGQPIGDVRVTEGGVVVVERATDAPVEIDPGTHVLHFERAGYGPLDQRVELAEGRRNQEVVVTMRAVAIVEGGETHVPSKLTNGSGGGLLVGAIAATSLALIGGGLFAGFGASGTSDENALKTSCAPYCTATQTSPVSTKFTIANVSLVTGIVALATAGVLWIVWGSSHKSPSAAAHLHAMTWTF